MAKAATSKRLTKKQYNALSPDEKKARREAKMNEATASYETALKKLTEGPEFRDHLAAAARLHNYSIANTFWVMFQRNGDLVPPIASFATWKRDLGYQVKKGEHGSTIWVPTPVIVDDDNAEDGKKTIMRFKTGTVFTRDQVEPIEGKALSIDPPRPAPITGDSHRPLISKLISLAETGGYEIKELAPDERPECEGYHDKTNKVIAYRPNRPANSIVRCLIHETIHSYGIGYEKWGRNRAEVITDSATYLACRLLGLDVEKASIPYVAAFGASSVDEVADSLSLMRKLANRIIDEGDLEDHLSLSEAEAKLRSIKKEKQAAKAA